METIAMTDAETILVGASIAAAVWCAVCIFAGIWFCRYAASGKLFSSGE